MMKWRPLDGQTLIQLIFWIAGLTAFLMFYRAVVSPSQLGVDAANTLSVTWNLIQGHGLRTSILWDDALFVQGSLPAEQTVWPPAQSVVAALVSGTTGMDPVHTLAMINATAHIVTALMVVILIYELGTSKALAVACGVVVLLAIPNWILVIRGHSEPLLSAALTAICLILVKLRNQESRKLLSPLLLAAVAALALAFLVRYQAIALLMPLLFIGVFARSGAYSQQRFANQALILAGALFVVVALILVRNYFIGNTLTGSNSSVTIRSITEVASTLELFPAWARTGVFLTQLVLVGVLSIAAVRLTLIREPLRYDSFESSASAAVLFSVFAIAGTAALIGALALSSPAYPWLARYFTPLFPLSVVAIVAMLILSGRRGRRLISSPLAPLLTSGAAVGLAIALAAPANALIDGAKGKPIQQAIAQSAALKMLLSAPVNQHGAPVLMSNQPSLLGIWSRHPILGTPFPDPRKPRWDLQRIERIVAHYGVTHIVQFSNYPQEWGRNDLDDMIKHSPAWLTVDHSGPAVTVYTVDQQRLAHALSQPRPNKLHAHTPPVIASGASKSVKRFSVQSAANCELRAHYGPLIITKAGSQIDGLSLQTNGVTAIEIRGADDVTIRNVSIRHAAGRGIAILNSDRVTLENLVVTATDAPPSGPHRSATQENIYAYQANNLTIRRARLYQGSSGVYAIQANDARLSEIGGEDFRGPFPRGQFIQLNNSHRAVIEDFYTRSQSHSWPEDNINIYRSQDALIQRGLIDGNNASNGVGIIFDGGTANGKVIDVDTIRMGNGAFSAYDGADPITFLRTRSRDDICDNQGRGKPSSGGVMWAGHPRLTQLEVIDSSYFNPCNQTVWPRESFVRLELTEKDFSLRPQIMPRMCWEKS